MTGVLRRLARPATAGAATDREERCELCGERIPPEHGHVVEVDDRRLLCTCTACRLLFTARGAGGGRYRAVSERYRYQASSPIGPAHWDAAQIPVSTAFFFHNSSLGRMVAFYPSPAGATECLLGLETCDEIAGSDPLFTELEPDVEAVLVTKNGSGFASYLVPIDACYELVGRIRTHWKGLDGGDEMRAEMDRFFTALRARSDGSVDA
jgi:hypothetical protein